MPKTDLPKRRAVRTPNLFSFAPSDMPGAARAAHRQHGADMRLPELKAIPRQLPESPLVQHLRPVLHGDSPNVGPSVGEYSPLSQWSETIEAWAERNPDLPPPPSAPGSRNQGALE
jgi:hypothetical protein